MTEKSVSFLGIITGALAIAAPLFYWWGVIAINYLYGFSLIDPMMYLALQPEQLIFLLIAFLVLLVGGILTLITAIKANKSLKIVGLILILAGFSLSFIATLVIVLDWGAPLFQIVSDGFVGLGPGFFLGVAAVVTAILFLIKGNSKESA